MSKCKHDNPFSIKLGSEKYEVDACVYEEIERHENVTVTVHKCKKCGHIDISWHRQENTVSKYKGSE